MFDSRQWRMIVSARFDDLSIKRLGAPSCGENREAGVNPARSRHCDEKCSQSQETCPTLLQPSQHSRTGVQAAQDSPPESRYCLFPCRKS